MRENGTTGGGVSARMKAHLPPSHSQLAVSHTAQFVDTELCDSSHRTVHIAARHGPVCIQRSRPPPIGAHAAPPCAYIRIFIHCHVPSRLTDSSTIVFLVLKLNCCFTTQAKAICKQTTGESSAARARGPRPRSLPHNASQTTQEHTKQSRGKPGGCSAIVGVKKLV